jgi:putative Holliday junction resolvase
MTTADHKNEMGTPRAPIIALDLGEKRVGVAVSDALSISIKRLEALPRSNWKQMLRDVDDLVHRFDAQTLVIGLPLRLNGSTGDAALEVQSLALKFARSLNVPVYLQDERLSSVEAEEKLRAEGHKAERLSALVDSEAAAVILRDFLVRDQERALVSPPGRTL